MRNEFRARVMDSRRAGYDPVRIATWSLVTLWIALAGVGGGVVFALIVRGLFS